MLFNSNVFIFAFLPFVFIIFIVIMRRDSGFAIPWLLLASIVFYSWWDISFLPILLCSIVFNFVIGQQIVRARESAQFNLAKIFLIAGIAGNLLGLGFFKYANFAGEVFSIISGVPWRHREIGLPLGISFFSLTQLAFLCDAYAGKVGRVRALHYGLFVTYFPHLIAGPVLHHGEVMPQFARLVERRRLSLAAVDSAMTMFAIGLFKKAILADHVAPYANGGFDMASSGSSLSFAVAATSTIAYMLQIYFDFSGYSDMAIGASMLFGIRLPHNFDSPYKSASIIEFWRRWHMTLSRFLRDYLYIPLGGNRFGPARRFANLMAVMLIGGLWHGAGWTFLIWGGLHGVYLVVNHFWSGVVAPRLGIGAGVIWRFFARTLTLAAVAFAWVFFRADSLPTAMAMLKGLAGINGLVSAGDFSLPPAARDYLGHAAGAIEQLGVSFTSAGGEMSLRSWLWIAPLLVCALFFPNSQQLLATVRPSLYRSCFPTVKALAWRPNVAWGLVAGGMVALSVLFGLGGQEFLYFQF